MAEVIMTIRLYEKDVYLKTCKAEIVDVREDDKGTWLALDQTVFFPTGGGQLCDVGSIDDVVVLEVIEKGHTVWHRVDQKPATDSVVCHIDWNRRLDMMQQHCGEHILSGIFMRKYKAVNKGFRVGEDYITIDIDMKDMTSTILAEVEVEANQAIYDNIAVDISIVEDGKAAQSFPVRKAVTVDENVRIVEIGAVDCVACCGTHPSRTGDVGIIKLLKVENYKGMSRVYFKCGMRALEDIQQKQKLLTAISQRYSADEATLLERLKVEEEKLVQITDKYQQLKKTVLFQKVSKILDEVQGTFITYVLDDMDIDDLKYIGKEILAQGSYILLLASKADNKVLLTHSGDHDLHCGKLFKSHIQSHNGRGGGGDKMAQGAFTETKDLMSFYQTIIDIIER